MCFEFKTPVTISGKQAVTSLQIIAFVQLGLLFARQICYFEFHALTEIFIIFLLWAAWTQLLAWLCQFYIFITLYKALIIGVFFATRFQNGKDVFGTEHRERVFSILLFATFLFYIIAQYFAFKAYKEFRLTDMQKTFVFEDQENQPLNQSRQQQQQPQASSSQQAIFQGRGVRIG